VSHLAATLLRVAAENIYASQGPLRETLRGRENCLKILTEPTFRLAK